MKYTVFLIFVTLYFYSFKNATLFLTTRNLFEIFDKGGQQNEKNHSIQKKKNGNEKERNQRDNKNLLHVADNVKEEKKLKKMLEHDELSLGFDDNEYEDLVKKDLEKDLEEDLVSKDKADDIKNVSHNSKAHLQKKNYIYSSKDLKEVKNTPIRDASLSSEMQFVPMKKTTKEKGIYQHNGSWSPNDDEIDEVVENDNELINRIHSNDKIMKQRGVEWENETHNGLGKNLDTEEVAENSFLYYKNIKENEKTFGKEHFLFDELKKVDYSEHGKNWNIGKCKSGKFQSPVDLHTTGLKERDLKNITDIYLNVFNDDEYLWNSYNKPWFRGDIFYYYEHLIKQLIIRRKDNVFQIKAANNVAIPFGVLFTTDSPKMFYADQIHFHSPSEHTFQGSGNRREIEMQIFHYTNDIYPYEDEAGADTETESENKTKSNIVDNMKNKKENKNDKRKVDHVLRNMKLKNTFEENDKTKNAFKNRRDKIHSYFFSFLKSTINNPKLEKKYMLDDKNKKSRGRYEVLSITFTSAEIDKTTLEMFQRLPSERFLRTIMKASTKVPVGSDPQLIDLEEPLNLDSLMMMLNVENMQFLSYHGSLTAPSCEENVQWKVAKQALPVSTELIFEFYKILNDHTPNYTENDTGNYRHLQNVNDNIKNLGKLYLIQGFPLQVLISSALSTADDREVVDFIKDVNSNNEGFCCRRNLHMFIGLVVIAITFIF